MGRLFELPDDFTETAQDGFDDILDLFGKQCKLVYPARFVECVNCAYDPIGKKSSNRWRTGGPMPFHAGSCPMCNGDGRRATENSETIVMTINWTPGRNVTFLTNIRVPIGSIIEARGYLTDVTKIKQCEEMLIVGEMAPYSHYKFKLESEPVDPFQLVSGRYFGVLWKRVG